MTRRAMVVLDPDPLRTLARAEKLDLLLMPGFTVLIPDMVIERLGTGSGRADALVLTFIQLHMGRGIQEVATGVPEIADGLMRLELDPDEECVRRVIEKYYDVGGEDASQSKECALLVTEDQFLMLSAIKGGNTFLMTTRAFLMEAKKRGWLADDIEGVLRKAVPEHVNDPGRTINVAPKTRQEFDARIEGLKGRFRYQFRGLFPYGFAVGQGWMPIIETLCSDLDTLLGPDDRDAFTFLQMKEKFGVLRVYWRDLALHARDELALDLGAPNVQPVLRAFVLSRLTPMEASKVAAIGDCIRAAETTAARTCEMCGAPGTLRSEQLLRTCCDLHAGT